MRTALACIVALLFVNAIVSINAVDRLKGQLAKLEKAWRDDCFSKNNGKVAYLKMPSKYLCMDENGTAIMILLR